MLVEKYFMSFNAKESTDMLFPVLCAPEDKYALVAYVRGYDRQSLPDIYPSRTVKRSVAKANEILQQHPELKASYDVFQVKLYSTAKTAEKHPFFGDMWGVQ